MSNTIQPGYTVAQIIQTVASATGIPAEQVTGPRRTRRICYARFLVMAAIKHVFPYWGLLDISEALGRGDHGTALHGLIRYRELYDTDQEFKRIATACGLPRKIQ